MRGHICVVARNRASLRDMAHTDADLRGGDGGEKIDLRDHYLNAGLSRREFAIKLGVTEQAIRRLENGLGVRPATAKRIADHLGVQVVDLLPADPEPEAA